MAWSYSGDPGDSELDEVRFLLQDTDSSLPLLTDEEILWLIGEWKPKYDSLVYVAAVGAATISRKFAGIVAVSTDGVSVNTGDLSQRYRDLAAELREQYKAAQVGAELDLSNIMVGYEPDPRIKPLRFGIGMHDNPEAGQQDYGGLTFDPFLDALTSPAV